jgi:prophage tail gpP-like protein
MITASTDFVNAINGTNRKYDIMVKFYRNTSGLENTPIDISDRIISYSCNYDFDSRSGRLNLEIDNYDYQLSPLNRASSYNLVSGVYNPLFDSNHRIELYEGVLINGAFTYVKKFVGYMGDEISASSEPTISISCRDKSKLLQDKYIFQGPKYSQMIVEDIIQDLLDEFAPTHKITLQVLDPTLYMVGTPDSGYTPKDTNLWDAIQLLADTAMQELRFMEDGSLVMRKIVRDFSQEPTDLVLGMSNLISDSMELSDSDVRNYIVVKVQGFDPITKTDDESIAKYGPRYMEVQRSMSDLITDVSQAHELAEGILRDLRFAYPTETAEIPFHPLVQVGDIVEITNPRLGTNPTNDIFKVLSVNNDYSKDRKRTTLQLQGYDIFLSTPDIAPNAPTGLSSLIQSRTIQNYVNSGWVGYEKTISFPMAKWTPPSQNASGNVLDNNFGGYVIERAHQLNKSGNIVATWSWGTIASIPSYISSLNKKVDYFYDYSASSVIDNYKKAGYSGNTVTLKYRLKAIGKKGSKSPVSSEMSVAIPVPIRKDASGNVLP